jgi:hypothetical protein
MPGETQLPALVESLPVPIENHIHHHHHERRRPTSWSILKSQLLLLLVAYNLCAGTNNTPKKQDPKSDSLLAERLFRSLLGFNSGLLAHGGENDDVYAELVFCHDAQLLSDLTGVLSILLEELLDLVTNFTIWNLDIVLGGAVVVHEGEEAVVSDIKLAQSISASDLRSRLTAL